VISDGSTNDHASTPAWRRLTATYSLCRASSGPSESVTIQRKGRGARQRVKNGQALMPTLKYLFRLAGPKILTLLALAVARTLLSNRLARLQACLRLLRDCCQSMCGHTAMSQPSLTTEPWGVQTHTLGSSQGHASSFAAMRSLFVCRRASVHEPAGQPARRTSRFGSQPMLILRRTCRVTCSKRPS